MRNAEEIFSDAGQLKLLYLALFCNGVRFLFASWIVKPWWIIPFELAQGMLNTCIWAAYMAFACETVSSERCQATQTLLHSIHHNLGRACGAILSGVVVAYLGSTLALRIYGLLSLLILPAFMLCSKRAKLGSCALSVATAEAGQSENHQGVEESEFGINETQIGNFGDYCDWNEAQVTFTSNWPQLSVGSSSLALVTRKSAMISLPFFRANFFSASNSWFNKNENKPASFIIFNFTFLN